MIDASSTVHNIFNELDSNQVGFLTLKDFQKNFSRLFDLSLKKNEVRRLFQEIDSDENGIITISEFEAFYNIDYIEKANELQIEKETKNTQNEIFDHIIRVLKQKGLTLQEMFE